MVGFKKFAWLSVAILVSGKLVDAQQLQKPAAENVSAFGGVLRSEVSGLRLLKFNGTLRDQTGQPLAGVVGVTFAIYKDAEGGAPLWQETQNVQSDSQGNYSTLLGYTTGQGIPPELLSPDEPRWVGSNRRFPTVWNCRGYCWSAFLMH